GLAFLLAVRAQPVAGAAGMHVVDEEEGDVGRGLCAGRTAAEHSETRHAGKHVAAGKARRGHRGSTCLSRLDWKDCGEPQGVVWTLRRWSTSSKEGPSTSASPAGS